MKLVFALAILAIVAALALAGRALLRDGRDGAPKSSRMVKALAWRVGLSIALFLFILLSHQMGWIQPTGIEVGR